MDRLVEIRFRDKSDLFFAVTYQILDASSAVLEGGEGTLPTCPALVASIKDWRNAYRAALSFRKLENIDSTTNYSEADYRELGDKVKKNLNDWLRSPEFLPLTNKLISKLDPEQVILIGIDMPDAELKYTPWQLWSFFEDFPKAEFAFLRPSFSKVSTKKYQKSKLNILAIIGDSRGIDTKEDTIVISNLPYTYEPKIMDEPSKKEVREALDSAVNTDILFFAGHGGKRGKGEICINNKETLSIGEIKSTLRKSIKQGLQLAIFNSCDGLELGADLADLHIPHTIVMKEAVPDQIAQRFLKSLLQEFSQEGVSLVHALRRTRDRLTDEDKEYPYASWLPVLYHNPSEPLMAWPKHNFAQKYPWRTGLAASCLISLVGLSAALARQVIINPEKIVSSSISNPKSSIYNEYFELPLPIKWKLENESNAISGDILHLYLLNTQDITLTLSVQDLSDNPLTLEKYYEKFIEDSKKSWNGSKVIQKKMSTKLDDRSTYTIKFSVNEAGKVYIKNVDFVLKNNKAYILIYSVPEKSFTEYENEVNKIISSLKLPD